MLQNANSVNQLVDNTKSNIHIYMEKGDYQAAENLVMELLSFNPFDHEMLYILSVIKFQRNELVAAQMLIEKAIKEDLQNSKYWCNLGIYLQEMKQYAHAEIAYKKAIEYDTYNVRALNILICKNIKRLKISLGMQQK